MDKWIGPRPHPWRFLFNKSGAGIRYHAFVLWPSRSLYTAPQVFQLHGQAEKDYSRRQESLDHCWPHSLSNLSHWQLQPFWILIFGLCILSMRIAATALILPFPWHTGMSSSRAYVNDTGQRRVCSVSPNPLLPNLTTQKSSSSFVRQSKAAPGEQCGFF